jgi:nucleotide-binding universal stress UspA family protein
MLAIKNILCATDFSESSDFAFRLACALARDYGARLVVLHVISPPMGIYGEGAVIPPPVGYQEPLREKLLQLQPRDKRIVVEHRLLEGEAPGAILAVAQDMKADRLLEGEAPGAILAVAQDMKADVIVMGTHGRKGLTRLLMGSVAEQVLRRASCPVLTVKKPLAGGYPPVEAAAEAADEVAVGAR